MRLNREYQMAPEQDTLGGNYHVVSRVVWREFIFEQDEKVYFYSLMRKYEAFCGVKVRAFCLMSNHFHLLVHVPPRPEARMRDEEFFEKLELVYEEDAITPIRKMIETIRGNGPNQEGKALNSAEEVEALVDEVKAPYLKRMWNLSEFVKVIKQRFTRWYNRTHGKSGTLWEGRFKSQLVQDGYAMKMTAAYIDLNPVRAGMVSDPKDYRWCSYGEAVAGGKRAQTGLLAVMNKTDKMVVIEEDISLAWQDVMGEYRMILAEEGLAVDLDSPMQLGENTAKRFKNRRGFSREEAYSILENRGKLSWKQLLHCKSRYFSEGLVIGSRAYVNAFFQSLKERTGNYEKRKTGARKLRLVDKTEQELCIMRDLR